MEPADIAWAKLLEQVPAGAGYFGMANELKRGEEYQRKQRAANLAEVLNQRFMQERAALPADASALDYGRLGLRYAPPGQLAATADNLAKAEQSKRMNDQIMQAFGGAGGTGLDVSGMRNLGTLLSMQGHTGASAVLNEAERRDKEAKEKISFEGMKARPERLAVGEQGPNIPAPAQAGAVPDYLMASKYVGPAAKTLQQRINVGSGLTSTSSEKAIENLAAAHNQMSQQEFLVGARGDEARRTASDKVDLKMTGGRESVYVQRMMMGANQAAKDLSNVVQLPLTASTGVFGGRRQGPGLFDAGKEVLANKATGQEAQAYNAMATGFQRSLAQIESAGLMPSGSLTHQMDAVLFKEGDTNLTKLHKLAQTRQIVEAGMEVIEANPRVTPEEKAKVKDVLSSIRKSVPFTHSDLIKLQVMQDTNPNATLKDAIATGRGAPKEGDKQSSRSGRAMIFRNNQWEYE